tara:strand:- start:546 stop:791 length:246 start_codon:yes stop_codon:yes gene_type:complete
MSNKWSTNSGKLIKTFDFTNFKEALKFINIVGQEAEAINHHPKIINIYNSVTLELWTHDQNTITDLDFQLADKIDSHYKEN